MLVLAFVVALQLTTADGFLEECPFDKTRVLGDQPVVDVLARFYHDLVFVGAATETRQALDYARELAEMAGPAGPDLYLINIARLLSEGRFEDAEIMLSGKPGQWYTSDDRRRTYLSYFQAETSRLLDRDAEAFDFNQRALGERQTSTGVSVDAMERLNSLLALKAVIRFNQDVDKVYGLARGPDFDRLAELHSAFRDNRAPFRDIRSALAHTLGDAKSGRLVRQDPAQDDTSGRSVARTSAEAALCEFARKLDILGVSSREPRPLAGEYKLVREQFQKLDFDLAWELRGPIASLVADNVTAANEALYKLWTPPMAPSRWVFIRYYAVEADRRSAIGCYLISKMQQGIRDIKRAREDNEGMGLDALYGLEARALFKSMDCVHRRLGLFYGLAGDEDGQQLAARRARFGAGDRKLPVGALCDADPAVF